jgi:DHA2 family multidrug resistance protein-like MFS transporter
LLAARSLPQTAPTVGPLNIFSISLYGVAVALIVIAAQVAVTHPFGATLLACVAVPCFLLLLKRERVHDVPILPLDLLARPRFRSSVVASICCFTGQAAGLIALPFYLQTGLGHGPLIASLVITCWPLSVAATSWLANRASSRFNPASQCMFGGAILAAGLLLLAILTTQNAVALLMIGAVLCGIGFGLFQLANNRSMFLSAPLERSAAAGGMQGTARLMGQTSGTLMISLTFACTSAAVAPRIGLAVGSALALVAALVSMRGIICAAEAPSRPHQQAPTSLMPKGCAK